MFPHQVVIQGILLMVAEYYGIPLTWLRVQGVFCQGLILHTMPNECLYSCTCLRQFPIPSKEQRELLNYGGRFPLPTQIEHLYKTP